MMNYGNCFNKQVLITIMAGLIMTGVSTAFNHGEVNRPDEWKDLVVGGRFMDRFEPMPILSERTSDTWGDDVVIPRDITLGIEDPKWSYWGGNIVVGDDGKYHQFIARWPESHPKGHMAWYESEIAHLVANNRFGPFRFHEVLGDGHNPEVYRIADGRYVCYVIGNYYLGETINGPWEKHKFDFNSRDRRIIDGLSNFSFVRREDGTFLAVCRGGGIWVSRDGLGPWEQVTQGRNYPSYRGSYEDPVIWRTNIQYHMIVNDWHGRIAYHLRSKDGVNWKVDSGEAYMPGVAAYADGQKEDWYKYERLRVFQDKHLRAIQGNFAVIDCPKRADLPNDNHNSKNIPIPLTAGRLLTLLNKDIPTSETTEIRLCIAAEDGFDPHVDIDISTLRYGAPEEVDYGRGSRLLKTEKDGNDLIAVFEVGGHGFVDHNFAGKLLGRTTNGKLLFGYSRLPWVTYNEAILSVRNPVIEQDEIAIEITNYGETASKASQVSIVITTDNGKTIEDLEEVCPALNPLATTTIKLEIPSSMKAGDAYTYTVTIGSETMNSQTYKTWVPKED